MDNPSRNKPLVTPSQVPDNDSDGNLVALIEALQEIDATKPTAKLNEISIIANNGGRIYF